MVERQLCILMDTRDINREIVIQVSRYRSPLPITYSKRGGDYFTYSLTFAPHIR